MEVYILDSLLRRIEVVDIFESLIWTERFAEKGDFELLVHSTREMRQLFTPGTRIAINNSFRVMTVETVEDGTDEEGKATLKLKGPSLEGLLENRIAATQNEGVLAQSWILTGTPGDVGRQIFDSICRDGDIDPGDVIPRLAPGKFYPDDTLIEFGTSQTFEVAPKSVAETLGNLCSAYDMGYRLVRDPDVGQLYFDIYVGSDRTTGQHVLPPVIFSPSLDNLQNTTELTSIAPEKNVAYVITPVGSLIVYPDGVDPEVAGFERRVMVVEADDITSTDAEIAAAAMLQKGREELAKNRSIRAFDGELAQNVTYKYDIDYSLGDIVEMRNVDGATNNMRVTEQIFVADREGERAYPTLTLNQYIMPGTWIAWDYNQVWLDLDDSPETWADQP
jgi:hypothetical protein